MWCRHKRSFLFLSVLSRLLALSIPACHKCDLKKNFSPERTDDDLTLMLEHN